MAATLTSNPTDYEALVELTEETEANTGDRLKRGFGRFRIFILWKPSIFRREKARRLYTGSEDGEHP